MHMNAVTVDPLSKNCTLEGTGGSGKVYQFDAAFGPECSTEKVYEDVGSVIVEAVLEGYNGTVFAYGQTGCGKSHTMHGFIERTLEHIFEATSTASSDTRYLALLSYLEIYNERMRDLLQDNLVEGALQLKEDPQRGTYVAGGLREVTVKNASECAKLVEQGDKKRVAAFTKMNASSSRSHAVLTISLEALAMGESSGKKGGSAVRRGQLHLVDLAGSERQARTGATGDRLKEAASINLSLSALGNVISALAAGNGRHVPYRDSKLTRLLRDSLGGNARTLMIACISPADVDAEETLSTLRYAARARCIKNKPVVNEDPKDALLRQYQLELQRLRKLLESSPKTADYEEDYEEREEAERAKREPEDTSTAQKLRDELDALRSRYEGTKDNDNDTDPLENSKILPMTSREVDERRRKKREAAQKEVMKRLERLTIGGEAQGNTELRKRRERRRRRLEILAAALEASAQDGSGSAFEVYGQLRTTEDALKRMAKRTKQLEAEALDLQASWDAERRELLRRELLATQICEAMIPYLRPGCPFRDLVAVRSSATWSDDLNRWRLPDASFRIPLPPPPPLTRDGNFRFKADLNNNSNGSNNSGEHNDDEHNSDDESRVNEAKSSKWRDIAGTYFRRNRIDELLARAREAKTFEASGRISKSGGSDDSASGYLQLNALNLQGSAPSISEVPGKIPIQPIAIKTVRPVGAFNAWLVQDNPDKSPGTPPALTSLKKHPPPRILEALPSYPLDSAETRLPSLSDIPFQSPDLY
ncbi:osmotic avoidance abnormal protein 3-like isoform X2 [Cotesia glomerata]|uniref:osmotic avoidance abnormal protein 3-like isoform X2 n=1 Tax=Cotesia glomerata TaxID=32391 RepID=UPI001D0077DB|nr:osmotic avoidance abnormal protein 3-like isoform X2 [Cotesia glomerata]